MSRFDDIMSQSNLGSQFLDRLVSKRKAKKPSDVDQTTTPTPQDLPAPNVTRRTPEEIQNFREGGQAHSLLSEGNQIDVDKEGNIQSVITPDEQTLSLEEYHIKKQQENESKVKELKLNLGANGFKTKSDNIIRYNNQNLENEVKNDFTGLDPIDNPELLPSQKDTIKDTIMQTPWLQVVSGLSGMFPVVLEGLQRYEAAKAELLQGDLKGVLSGVSGTTETEFPDAKLRGSGQTELGDVFRKMGLPEWVAATGGLALDIITDIPVFFGAGVGIKQFGKHATKVGLKQTAHAKWLAFRGNSFVKITEEALAGKGKFWSLPEETIKTMRKAGGTANKNSVMAGVISNNLGLLAQGDEVMLKQMDNLLKGSIKPQQANKLSDAARAYVNQGRVTIDNASQELVNLLKEVADTDPKGFERISQRLGAVEGMNAEQLIATIEKNQGSYVKRMYELFKNKNYKPSKQVFDNAVRGLVADGMDEVEAISKLNTALKTKKIGFLKDKAVISIDSSSFKARNDIPKYMREFMGEIEHPLYNLTQTVAGLGETTSQIKFFRGMNKAGLFSDLATKTHTTQIAGGSKSLAWSLLDGKHTTPEVAELLEHLAKQSDMLDDVAMRGMKVLKLTKTVGNPKTHTHNFMGNILFSILSGNSITNPKNWKHYKEMTDMWQVASKVAKGGEKIEHPLYQKWLKLVDEGVIGTELPSAEKLTYLDDILANPYKLHEGNLLKRWANKTMKTAADFYSFEDQLFKGATYSKYISEGKFVKSADAVAEMYKWYPNYAEAARLADVARNTAAGLLVGNPFTTFRAEAHRIFLNSLKEGARTQTIMGLNMASRAAWNTALLAGTGMGIKDISEYFLSDPDAVSEVMHNPLSPEYELNLKYIDPINTEGLFAPFMAMSGAQGVHPLDYLLDFTNFSPEFGYSNLITNFLEPAITGRGKYGQDLGGVERVAELVKGVVGSSFGVDLPKIVNPETEGTERLRRAMRFFGIDVQKRDPKWVKSEVRKRLEKKVEAGEDPSHTLKGIEYLGFDAPKMLKSVEKKIARKKRPKKITPSKPKRKSDLDKALAFIMNEK